MGWGGGAVGSWLVSRGAFLGGGRGGRTERRAWRWWVWRVRAGGGWRVVEGCGGGAMVGFLLRVTNTDGMEWKEAEGVVSVRPLTRPRH